MPGVAYGTSVNLQAPATDPAGYTFSQWTVNGAAQTAGQKSVTFTMTAATTAVAEYTREHRLHALRSVHAPGRAVHQFEHGPSGTTNYTKAGVA